MKRAGLVLGLLFLALAGCDRQSFLRLQSDDDEQTQGKTADVQTIGDVTRVWGTEPVRLYGVGVVVSLGGNGRDSEPNEYRRMAMHDLKQKGIEDPAKYLATGDAAVVLVSAVLPPGIRKADPIDVEVEVPPRDKTLTLRGGYLASCDLREYADANTLRAAVSGNEGPRGSIKGKVLARAEGPLVVGLGDKGDKERLRRGRIWGGGKALIDRNFALLLDKDDDVVRGARLAKSIADRINESFHGPFRGTLRGVAEAKDNQAVTLKVPAQYRFNVSRFLRVVKHIPLRQGSMEMTQYRRQLSEQLLDPAKTVVAALKLEALGQDSIDDLKKGLAPRLHPLTRFSSAEALAYLGDPSCGEPLAELVEKEERLRSFGLSALASLNEAICYVKLRELMASNSAETRYGAFRALRALDEKDRALGEEYVNESFYLHRVAPNSPPMIHVSSARRAEIVLFGEDAVLAAPFYVQAGPDFVVTAEEGDDRCTIARLSVHEGTRKEPCSLRVEDVLRKLAEMGADYPDVVELLRQAGGHKNLSCRLEVDALPKTPSVYSLAAAGVIDGAAMKNAEDADGETVELGSAPELFATPGRKGTRVGLAGERSPGGE